MDGIFDFFSREAGQRRRRDLEDAITYYVPPELRGLLGVANEMNPVTSMERAGQDAQVVFAPDAALMDRLAAGGRMASNMAGVVAPAAVAGRAGLPAAQAVEEALTGFSTSPQALGVIDFAADESGAFGGIFAKTANREKLAAAQSMDAAGASADDIWSSTGWFKGVDGKWRFEIPDAQAEMVNPDGGTVGEIIRHDALFSAYPDLASTPARYSPNVGWQGFAEASYSPAGVEVYASQDDAIPAFLHELQHGIQGVEGFARGGSPLMFSDPDLAARMLPGEDALSAYKRLAGEVEARDVEKRFRRNMSSIRPGALVDVPPDRQIIRGLLDGEVQRSTPTDPAAARGQEIMDLLTSGRGGAVTDEMLDLGDPVQNARLNEWLFNNYDLPMDAASRAARAGDMGMDTAAYHATGADFQAFRPGWRGSNYFAQTADKATRGAVFGALDNASPTAGTGGAVTNNVMPLVMPGDDVAGLRPSRAAWDALPNEITQEQAKLIAGNAKRATGAQYFSDIYDEVEVRPPAWDARDNLIDAGEYRLVKKPFPAAEYADLNGRDGMGYMLPGFNSGTDFAALDNLANTTGQKGFLVSDEAGTSIVAGADMPMRSRFARFDPRLSHLKNLNAGVAATAFGGGLLASPDDADAMPAPLPSDATGDGDLSMGYRDTLGQLYGVDGGVMTPRGAEVDGLLATQPQRRAAARQEGAAFDEALRSYLGPTGIPERLAAANEAMNPVEGLSRAGTASQVVFNPNTGGWERVGAVGDMLSETAGAALGFGGVKQTADAVAPLVDDGLLALGRFGVDESGALRLYHGSPHDFPAERLVRMPDGSQQFVVGAPGQLPELPTGAELVRDFPLGRFRMDKMGTGEGAQAFGSGLYFGEAEGVAQGYRDALSPSRVAVDGRIVDSPVTRAAASFSPSPDDYIKALKVQRERAARNLELATSDPELGDMMSDIYRSEIAEIDGKIAELQPLSGGWFHTKPDGRMYEVQINANPEDFLDSDVALNRQPDAVRGALDPLMGAIESARMNDFDRKEILSGRATGADLYSALKFTQGGAPQATDFLQSQGIPGIRYLDAGSRGAGDGSRNYVVFDDSLIEILRKYGVAGLLAGGGAAAMQPGQAQAAPAGGLLSYGGGR